jgi:hypothetical protein
VIHDEPPSPRKLNASVGKDLETITLKCLEKVPNRRYQSAHDLALELRRYLFGEPILARPVSRMERAWRWAKRKPMMATTAALVVLLGIAGPIAALREQHLRRLLETRFRERDNLINQKEREMQQSAQAIGQLRSQLDRWEGDATPAEVWPAQGEESPRRIVLRDAFEKIKTPLVKSLEKEQVGSREASCGYLGLAIMADAAGRQADAIQFYTRAIGPLEDLRQDNPDEMEAARALAECYTRLAGLVGGDDRAAATEYLSRASKVYGELAHNHQDHLEFKIALMGSELNRANLAGLKAGRSHLRRVAKLNELLLEKWPGDPVASYQLACFLLEREPLLAPPQSAPHADSPTPR